MWFTAGDLNAEDRWRSMESKLPRRPAAPHKSTFNQNDLLSSRYSNCRKDVNLFWCARWAPLAIWLEVMFNLSVIVLVSHLGLLPYDSHCHKWHIFVDDFSSFIFWKFIFKVENDKGKPLMLFRKILRQMVGLVTIFPLHWFGTN